MKRNTRVSAVVLATLVMAGCATTGQQGSSGTPVTTVSSAQPAPAPVAQPQKKEAVAASPAAAPTRPVAKASAPAPAPSTAQSQQEPQIVKTQTSGSVALSFVDINSFDNTMAKTMKEGPDEVVVNLPSSFDLNNVPERMNKWFSALEENGGAVKLEKVANVNDPTTRGFETMLISWAIDMLGIGKNDPYSIAKNYKTAVMTYDEATGKVVKVAFYK